MPFLPEGCSTGLALRAEAIDSWADNCDLAQFLGDLYDQDVVGYMADGRMFRSNSRDYGLQLYADGRTKYLAKAVEFGVTAHAHRFETLEGQGIPDQIPVFEQDPDFGLMAKYAIALEGVTTAMLEESAFFSVAHMLEVVNELECSQLLASHLFYKQALQVLRGFVELSVLHLAFANYPDRYARWVQRDVSFRIPALRASADQIGLIEKLQLEGLIPDDLRRATERLYGDLNGAIHSNEARLINRGADTDAWVGLQFKRDQYVDWCRYLAQSAIIGIRLLAYMLALRLHRPHPEGLTCSECGQRNSYDIVAERSRFVTIKCRDCGHEFDLIAEVATAYGIGHHQPGAQET
jgi:hypothetical protein